MHQYPYYFLNELVKSFHVFSAFDARKASAILKRINDHRLQIAVLADQREIFVDQIEVPANASGYKNDVFFTHDDIASLVIRFVASLQTGVTVTLVQEGTRENLFTREPIAWQQLMSEVQFGATVEGQHIPFDLPQEIFLQKAETLDIGIVGQTEASMIFVHGANLKDDYAVNSRQLNTEIFEKDPVTGKQLLPQPVLVPIKFTFPSADEDTKAVGIDGGDEIFSIKTGRSVVLTDVSTTSVNSRITLLDRGRNQEICNEVESNGVAGRFSDQFATWYPLPYCHLLRAYDRLQLRALNGSAISGDTEDANVIQTLCFRGYTI